MLDRLGMSPLLDTPTDELSGGQAKRAALARLLVGEYEVLILDEPTNHLDLDAIQFLEEWLAAYRGGLVLVTHDRHVLDKVTTKVLELDRGRGLPARADWLACAARGTRRTSPVEPNARNAPRWPNRFARTWRLGSWRGCDAARRRAPRSRRPASPPPPRWSRAGRRPPPRDGDLGLAMGSQATWARRGSS